MGLEVICIPMEADQALANYSVETDEQLFLTFTEYKDHLYMNLEPYFPTSN